MTPPRALVGPVMAMARPARPPEERRLVQEGVAAISAPGTPAETAARALAARVVEELAAFLAEDTDPMLAALGNAKRKLYPTAVTSLATDPDIDTLALFVDDRVERLRARCGRALSLAEEAAELQSIMCDVRSKLAGRYLRHIRASKMLESETRFSAS